jgi:hypothetical protein
MQLESAEQARVLHRTVEFRVVAQEEQQIRGRLRDAHGKPVPHAHLMCMGNWPAPNTMAETEADGSFELATHRPSKAAFTLRLAGHALVLDSEVERRYRGVVEGRVSADELSLTAIAPARIRGRMVDAEGRGVANVEVQLRRGSSYYASMSRCTDAEGRFAFAGLNGRDAEAFRVHVEEEAGFVDGEPFQLVDGGTRELAPTVLRPPAAITGVVHGPDGKPLPGARVLVRRCDATTGIPSDGSRIEMVADRTGRFRFAGLEPRAWRLYSYALGSAAEESEGPWFELRSGVAEQAVLEPGK